VRTPHIRLGAAAADLLFDEIDRMAAEPDDLDAADRPQVLFAPELVVRCEQDDHLTTLAGRVPRGTGSSMTIPPPSSVLDRDPE
jgi:hypothetical protein